MLRAVLLLAVLGMALSACAPRYPYRPGGGPPPPDISRVTPPPPPVEVIRPKT